MHGLIMMYLIGMILLRKITSMSEQINKLDYQLVIRIPIKAVDNIEARHEANKLHKIFSTVKCDTKLQQLMNNDPPSGVSFNPVIRKFE